MTREYTDEEINAWCAIGEAGRAKGYYALTRFRTWDEEIENAEKLAMHEAAAAAAIQAWKERTAVLRLLR